MEVFIWMYDREPWGMGFTEEAARQSAYKKASLVAEWACPVETEPVIQKGFAVKIAVEADPLRPNVFLDWIRRQL